MHLLIDQQDRLPNTRLSDELDRDTFARKDTEFRDGLASIKTEGLQMKESWGSRI